MSWRAGSTHNNSTWWGLWAVNEVVTNISANSLKRSSVNLHLIALPLCVSVNWNLQELNFNFENWMWKYIELNFLWRSNTAVIQFFLHFPLWEMHIFISVINNRWVTAYSLIRDSRYLRAVIFMYHFLCLFQKHFVQLMTACNLPSCNKVTTTNKVELQLVTYCSLIRALQFIYHNTYIIIHISNYLSIQT